MRILLITPPSIVFTKSYFTKKPSLTLGYLSAFLKQNGHETKILNLNQKQDFNSFKYILKAFNPTVVGITAYTPNALDGFELAKTVKSINNECITVMGGSHSTSMPEATLEACNSLDFIVIGEGEVTLLDLCNKLERKDDISQVKGLCYRHNGKIIRTKSRPLIEKLDDLPFPDRFYYKGSGPLDHNFNFPSDKILEILTSRGCTDFCTFCSVHRAYLEKGRSLRLRSAENVLREIEFYKIKDDIQVVFFLDDSFVINRNRTRQIVSGLKDMKLLWSCDSRVNLLDEDLIHEMVESGCKKISIGVESGSERILSLIRKNITIEQTRRVFKWCHEARLETIEANFLIGSHPDETMEDVNKTRRFIKELSPQRLLFSITVPFPGTQVREQMLARKLIFSNDWRRYILIDDEPPPWRTTYLDSRELKRLQNIMLAEFYFSFKSFVRNLKYIRSFPLFKIYFFSSLEIIKKYIFYKIKKVIR